VGGVQIPIIGKVQGIGIHSRGIRIIHSPREKERGIRIFTATRRVPRAKEKVGMRRAKAKGVGARGARERCWWGMPPLAQEPPRILSAVNGMKNLVKKKSQRKICQPQPSPLVCRVHARP
jgi:hypothetical protein